MMTLTEDKKEEEVTTQLKEVMFAQGGGRWPTMPGDAYKPRATATLAQGSSAWERG